LELGDDLRQPFHVRLDDVGFAFPYCLFHLADERFVILVSYHGVSSTRAAYFNHRRLRSSSSPGSVSYNDGLGLPARHLQYRHQYPHQQRYDSNHHQKLY